MSTDTFFYYLTKYLDYYPFLLPLGFIGVWRWTVWGIKKGVGIFYKPQPADYKTSVSVVTPVYNENPKTFKKALESWIRNNPKEIIAVIDYTDKKCIQIFKKFAKSNRSAKLLITKIPGKRPALANGIKKANSQVVALVDSDTIWDANTLKNGIAPFKDKRIGGVATKQSLIKPKTLAQKLFSIRLEQRYWDDIPFLSRVGDILVCLSGRTAFYRRKAVLPLLNKLVNEEFMGKKVISGEDKRLTYLIEAAGWKATYQSTALVYTYGEKNLSTFLNQQIRWTRNSWRSDLKALYEKWVFRSPIYTLYLIDRAIQPFTLLISPVFFAISLYLKLWIPVIVILTWWCISRTIKMLPHLQKYPLDIIILPLFILFNFASAYIRIYALLSLNTQGWITRWHASRLNNLTFFQKATGHIATILLFALVAVGVYFNKYNSYLIPQAHQKALLAKSLPHVATVAAAAPSEQNILGISTDRGENTLTRKHIFQPGESLWGIANLYGVTFDNLLNINASKITNFNRIDPGVSLTIPPVNINILPSYRFNTRRIYPDYLNIFFDSLNDQIVVAGRGKIVTLAEIAQSVGKEYIEETEKGTWELKSSLYLRSGVTLRMDGDQVKWLKLTSNNKKNTRIFAYNSDVFIRGVTITSWDHSTNDFDKNLNDGRAYILVKDGSRLDITDSELAYLGYPRPTDHPYSTYGVSWRMSTGRNSSALLTGEVINSKFHHNYFGAYTYGATGMIWRGNEFYDNTRYGLDPHDDSNGFLVEQNIFRNNGTHGLIFSKRCIDNVIRNNVSFGNKLHGIMLHEKSNKNIIIDNKIYDNHDGIALDHSSENVIRNNIIYNNKRGIKANKASLNNLIESNSITGSSQYGIYLYGKSDNNIIENNIFTDNLSAIYVKSNGNLTSSNTLSKNKAGIYFSGTATNNEVKGNKITYNKTYGVYAKLSTRFVNYIEENNFVWRNKRDLFVYEIE